MKVMGMLDQHGFSGEVATKIWLECITEKVGGKELAGDKCF